MRNFKHLVSILLLGLYSLVLLHHIIPHTHSVSEASNDEIAGVLHAHDYGGHHHHHHSHDHDGQETGWLEVLLGLLGDLEHSELGDGHLENYTILPQNSPSDIALNKKVKTVVHYFESRSNTNLSLQTEYGFIDPPPLLYELPAYTSDPLRGPPSFS